MTNNDLNAGSGEARLKKRRNTFIRYFVLACIGFGAVGFLSGYVQGSYEDGEMPLWIPLTLIAVVLVALAWFTWDYFRRVDELEIMDNLWAHLIGQYVAVLTFMGWYFLADLDLVAYPTALGVMAVMVGATALAYFARKFGLR